MAKKGAKTEAKLPIILCCGENGRAVIFGRVHAAPVAGAPVEIFGARMILCWSRECGGLLGLAAHGPKTNTRITAAVPRIVETRWQEYVEVVPDAAVAIDRWASC